MPHFGVFLFTRQFAGVASVTGLSAAMGYLLCRFFRPQTAPEEAERLRRLRVNRNGKLGDGEIVEFEGAAILYSYRVSGVGYMATQDLAALEALLPVDRMSAIGAALIKFDPRNPANSIVLCEGWSGLRCRERDRTV